MVDIWLSDSYPNVGAKTICCCWVGSQVGTTFSLAIVMTWYTLLSTSPQSECSCRSGDSVCTRVGKRLCMLSSHFAEPTVSAEELQQTYPWKNFRSADSCVGSVLRQLMEQACALWKVWLNKRRSCWWEWMYNIMARVFRVVRWIECGVVLVWH